MLCLSLSLGLVSAVSAGDGLRIKTILQHPADYQAKVVIVAGRAKAVSSVPVHRGTRRCGGSAVYDSQLFALRDGSGTIGVSTPGTCLPNVTKPVVENERLRIRGVVKIDQTNSKAVPVIDAAAVDRMAR
ncbi:MAG: hypothetical protein ABS70_00355 [Nitrospira sp. SCN 59-13]|nr:MAG: hypothetical protein ABS70_00355 [Nitrospira sp. SCN 59-13]